MPLSRENIEPIPGPAQRDKPETSEASTERIAFAAPMAAGMLSQELRHQKQEEARQKAQEEAHKAAERARIERMPVVSINIMGRKANPIAPQDALHLYIDITHAEDGQHYHEILEALPMQKNGAPPLDDLSTKMAGFSQDYLMFVPGGEADRDDLKSPNKTLVYGSDLHAPTNMSLGDYARSLREGALASNNSLHHYDFVGEDGYNSNSWAYSLVLSRGGSVGKNDLDDFAKEHLPLMAKKLNSREDRNDQRIDSVHDGMHKKQWVAPGFGHNMPKHTFDVHRQRTADPMMFAPHWDKIGPHIWNELVQRPAQEALLEQQREAEVERNLARPLLGRPLLATPRPESPEPTFPPVPATPVPVRTKLRGTHAKHGHENTHHVLSGKEPHPIPTSGTASPEEPKLHTVSETPQPARTKSKPGLEYGW